MLYLSGEFTNELIGSITTSTKSIVVCSAYIKSKALKSLLDDVNGGIDLKVVARWQKGDLVFGSSDLEVYEICRDNGWSFGIDTNLHGKVYVIDDRDIFLGSANLTQRGMSFDALGNNEFGTKIEPDKVDLDKFYNYIKSEVVWCDDELYKDLKNEVNSSDKNEKQTEVSWSKSVISSLTKPVSSLWVSELPRCSPEALLQHDVSSKDLQLDLNLLSLSPGEVSDSLLSAQVKSTRFYHWLITLLQNNGSCRFGTITKELHDALIDDPKPYRKDVKDYVQNIFSWMEFLVDDFVVDRPNHTQVARMKNK